MIKRNLNNCKQRKRQQTDQEYKSEMQEAINKFTKYWDDLPRLKNDKKRKSN